LETLGISIDVGKIHCPILSIKGKKHSGNAQAIIKGVLLQHGTILLHVDADLMYKILKAPIGVSYSKMVQSVRTKVTGILDVTSDNLNFQPIDELTIVNALKNGFEQIFGITLEEQSLTTKEMSKIEILAESKYRTESWLTKYP
jgi:lipoate-protein ligase A